MIEPSTPGAVFRLTSAKVRWTTPSESSAIETCWPNSSSPAVATVSMSQAVPFHEASLTTDSSE